MLEFASQRRAYAIVGHIPVAFEKRDGEGIAVPLKGNPCMRWLYSVLEFGPRHPADAARREYAWRLAEYLVSEQSQRDLAKAYREVGGPWIFPLV